MDILATMTGDPATLAGVYGILAAIAGKAAWDGWSRRNGAAPLTRQDFGAHCTAVERMFKDDPPRRHTELLQKLIRESERQREEHGKKLDAIVDAIGRLPGQVPRRH